MIAVLCGGVGAARLLRSLLALADPPDLTAIVNVADDLELHGLHISPDLDTVVYTTAGEIDPDRGWGLRDETWQAMELLSRYRGADWFRLGDRDLGTHLYRTQRLADGAALSEVTAEIAAAWGLDYRVLPVTDDRVRTTVDSPETGTIDFQEYFVGHRHDIPVTGVTFVGADTAVPAPGVVTALESATRIVIAPSNPIVSIGPLLAVPGLREAIRRRRADTWAISPIIGGRALKGPADRLLTDLGHESSALGVARIYADLASTMVIDVEDTSLAAEIQDLDMTPVVTDTIMADHARSVALASLLVDDRLEPARARETATDR